MPVAALCRSSVWIVSVVLLCATAPAEGQRPSKTVDGPSAGGCACMGNIAGPFGSCDVDATSNVHDINLVIACMLDTTDCDHDVCDINCDGTVDLIDASIPWCEFTGICPPCDNLPPLGACCVDLGAGPTCSLATESLCDLLTGSVYHGDTSSCLGDADSNGLDDGCEVGACCNGAACQDTFAGDCMFDWVGGQTCATLGCQFCGNGVVEVGAGEECDDGNVSAGDGCDGNCIIELCGNGIPQAGEACDDGNLIDGDGCNSGCQVESACCDGATCSMVDAVSCGFAHYPGQDCATFSCPDCGNAVCEPGETTCNCGSDCGPCGGNIGGAFGACVPDGMANVHDFNHIIDCMLGANPCVDVQCDINCDGTVDLIDASITMCEFQGICPPCSNLPALGACCFELDATPRCSLATEFTCALLSGAVFHGEGSACAGDSSGNGVDDGCEVGACCAGRGCQDVLASDCSGSWFAGEACATLVCASCGDGVLDDGEECDDNNSQDGDGCDSACRLEVCGNGVVQDGEACDDGNSVSGDGCSAACVIESACCDGVSCSMTTLGDCAHVYYSGRDCTSFACPTCGDGACQPGETTCDCPADCGPCSGNIGGVFGACEKDEVTNVNDLAHVLDCMSGTNTCPDVQCDINCDGVVDLVDASITMCEFFGICPPCSNLPELGACCFLLSGQPGRVEARCSLATRDTCELMANTPNAAVFTGEGTTCAGDGDANGLDDACQITGACCEDSACEVTFEGDCPGYFLPYVSCVSADCGLGCVSAADCCDIDNDGVRDNNCVWCDCVDGSSCDIIALTEFADMGGAFGTCPPDQFANIHDRTHALSCFSGTNSCDSINIDAGGAFGGCPPDGFCNIHDANHALQSFAGISTCSCPSGPAPVAPVVQSGSGSLKMQSVDGPARPGDTIKVRALVDASNSLHSYQLHISVSGGRQGRLELVDIMIESRNDDLFADRADTFEAFNVESGQMLRGLDDPMASSRGPSGYLATFVYRVSKDARGEFVVDAAASQNYLIGPGNTEIIIESSIPAVIRIPRKRERSHP